MQLFDLVSHSPAATHTVVQLKLAEVARLKQTVEDNKINEVFVISAIGRTRQGKSTSLNIMAAELSNSALPIPLQFAVSASVRPVTSGIQAILMPWTTLNEHYKALLGTTYPGKTPAVLLVDCEGSGFNNHTSGKALYLLSLLMSSVVHIHVPKTIEDYCEEEFRSAIKLAVDHIPGFSPPHLYILIKDVDKEAYPTQDMQSLLDDKPNFKWDLNKFLKYYSVLAIYERIDADKMNPRRKDTNFYQSLCDCLKASLSTNRPPPALLSMNSWLTQLEDHMGILGSALSNESDIAESLTMQLRKRYALEFPTKVNDILANEDLKEIVQQLQTFRESNTTNMQKIKLSEEYQIAIPRQIQSLIDYFEFASSFLNTADAVKVRLLNISTTLEKETDSHEFQRKGGKISSISGAGVGVVAFIVGGACPPLGVAMGIGGSLASVAGVGVSRNAESKLKSVHENTVHQLQELNEHIKAVINPGLQRLLELGDNVVQNTSRTAIALGGAGALVERSAGPALIVAGNILPGAQSATNIQGAATAGCPAGKWTSTNVLLVMIAASGIIGIVLDWIVTYGSCEASHKIDEVLQHLRNLQQLIDDNILQHPQKLKATFTRALPELLMRLQQDADSADHPHEDEKAAVASHLPHGEEGQEARRIQPPNQAALDPRPAEPAPPAPSAHPAHPAPPPRPAPSA